MEMAFLESTMRSAPMSFQEQGIASLQVITNRGGNGAAGAAAAASETPWWAGAGSQLLIGGESFGQSSHLVMEDIRHHQILAARRQARCFMYPGPAMPPEGSVVKFPIISGNSDLGKDLKFHEPPAPTVSAYPGLPESQGHFELALGQSMHAKMLLPSVIATDGPIYVNAKQFNAIVRRRLARAKAGRENKVSRNRKPYRHESRHLHAMRRARGSGGRFLAKNLSGEQAIAGGPPTWSTNTPPSSEGPDSNDNNYSEGTSVSPAQENMGDFHAVGAPPLADVLPGAGYHGGWWRCQQ